MTDDSAVVTDAAGGVLTITLNRPKARNAVNRALAEGVAAALERLDTDDDLRVGVITGAGGRSAPAWTSRLSPPANVPSWPGGGLRASRSARRASR
jgi:enoyl-CoA hydratase